MRNPSRLRAATKLLGVVVAAFVIASCSSASGGSSNASKVETVRIGSGPYFEYQPWVVAHELGLDKQQGLDLQISNIASTQTAALAAKRGDLDIVASCHACDFPIFKAVPDLQDFMITDQFKGFILVGRKGAAQTFTDLSGKVGADTAKQQILQSLKGKTFVMHKVSYESLLTAALDQVGLSANDIKIADFPDDASAGLAFSRGEGDYYIGSLPQEAKLLQSPDQYVNVGGTDILGPAGLWYSTMASTSGWLGAHKATVNKLLAVWYRTMTYLKQQPDKVMPIFTKAINKAAASNLPEDQVKYIVTNLDFFPTLDEAKSSVYGHSSPLYFQKSVTFYEQGNKSVLPSNFDASRSIVDEKYFNDFNGEKALVDWANAPIS